jgi:hypothetical protein
MPRSLEIEELFGATLILQRIRILEVLTNSIEWRIVGRILDQGKFI